MGYGLSEDLRWRVIRAWQKKKSSTKELAAQFGIGEATVKRWRKRFLATKSIKPLPRGGGMPRKIKPEQEPIVAALVQAHPDWSEDKYAEQLAAEHGVEASAACVGRVIRRLGYSVKKRRSSPKSVTVRTLLPDGTSTSKKSETLPFRVWFLWTKPARTSR
jgi:putative transposase